MNGQSWHKPFAAGEECLETVEIVTEGKVMKRGERCSKRPRKDGGKRSRYLQEIERADSSVKRVELKDKKHLSSFCRPLQQIVMSTESSGAAGSCDSSEVRTSKPQCYAFIRSVQIEPCGRALINTSLYFNGKFAKHKSTLQPFVMCNSISAQTTQPQNETLLNEKPTVLSSHSFIHT